MKSVFALLLFSMFCFSCSNKSVVLEGEACNNLICVEVKASESNKTDDQVNQRFIMKMSSSDKKGSIHQYFNGLDTEMQASIQFNYFEKVKMVCGQNDTLSAVFSHMESNGNIGAEITQIVGFDSLIDFKSKNHIQILFDDKYFSQQKLIIALK